MPRDHTFEAPPEPEDELLVFDAGHYFAEEFGTTAAEQAAHEPLGARLAREEADVGPDGEVTEAPARRLRMDEPGHWNVLASARPNHGAEVRATLAELGVVLHSPYPNLFVAAVDDVSTFGDDLGAVLANRPAAARAFARAFPAQHTFHFDSLADLEAITASLIDDWADDLAGASFHVRCRRRGRATDLDPIEVEDFLGDAIMRTLAARNTPGRVDFRDPDVVIDIETLDREGAVSLWTRDDMRSFAFLMVE